MGADSDEETAATEEQPAGALSTGSEPVDNNQLISIGAKARLANLKM